MTADEWRPPAEKRCEATKANVPRLQSTASAEGMKAGRTLTAIFKEYAQTRRLSNCCARSEALAPPRVDALSYP